jgi:hypothetical protein
MLTPSLMLRTEARTILKTQCRWPVPPPNAAHWPQPSSEKMHTDSNAMRLTSVERTLGAKIAAVTAPVRPYDTLEMRQARVATDVCHSFNVGTCFRGAACFRRHVCSVCAGNHPANLCTSKSQSTPALPPHPSGSVDASANAGPASSFAHRGGRGRGRGRFVRRPPTDCRAD